MISSIGSSGADFEGLGLSLVRASLDGLTVSLTESESDELYGEMLAVVGAAGCDIRPLEGKAGRGFGASESWALSLMNEGVRWFRRFDPATPSKTLGSHYESWEVMGPAAATLASVLLSAPVRVGRASRLDAAFDYECEPEMWPPAIEEAISDWAEVAGFVIHHQGERDTRTVYVGAPSSERRVRIYRHDRVHAGSFPLMRVEVELRRKYADEAWKCWWPEGGPGLALCAGHIERMTGRRVWADEITYPEPEPDKEIDLVTAGAFSCLQYGNVIDVLRERGVAIESVLSRLRAMPTSVRRQQLRDHRSRVLRASVDGMDAAAIEAAILARIETEQRWRSVSLRPRKGIRRVPRDPTENSA